MSNATSKQAQKQPLQEVLDKSKCVLDQAAEVMEQVTAITDSTVGVEESMESAPDRASNFGGTLGEVWRNMEGTQNNLEVIRAAIRRL